MRRVVFLGLLISVLISCSNDLERKIEGKWQLKHVVEDGVTTVVDTVYYNFQNALFGYQIANGAPGTDALVFGYKTELNDNKALLLELPDENFVAKRTDWSSTEETFEVVDASASNLVLKCNGRTYQFKKF